MTIFLTEQRIVIVTVLFSLQLLLQVFLFPPDVRSSTHRTSYKTYAFFIYFTQKSALIAVKDLELDKNVLSGSHADGEKFFFVQALRLCTGRTAHRGSRGIALPFLDQGTRRG